MPNSLIKLSYADDSQIALIVAKPNVSFKQSCFSTQNTDFLKKHSFKGLVFVDLVLRVGLEPNRFLKIWFDGTAASWNTAEIIKKEQIPSKILFELESLLKQSNSSLITESVLTTKELRELTLE